MARSVRDIALMLQATAGPDPACPLSINEPGELFGQSLELDCRNLRVAWAPTLGDIPVASEVLRVMQQQRRV